MTTSEFIKMLQKADPSGNAHIRMGGGVPQHAELKDGYYDGAYSYIDKDGNYVYSTAGSKVDIYSVDVEEFVEHQLNIHDKNNLENILSKFKFELGVYAIKERQDERKNSILNQVKTYYNEMYEFEKKLYQESIDEAVNRCKSGWQFFQNKKVDTDKMFTYYSWKIISPDGKIQSSSAHDTEGLLYCGLFQKLDNNKMDGYYEWQLI